MVSHSGRPSLFDERVGRIVRRVTITFPHPWMADDRREPAFLDLHKRRQSPDEDEQEWINAADELADSSRQPVAPGRASSARVRRGSCRGRVNPGGIKPSVLGFVTLLHSACDDGRGASSSLAGRVIRVC